MAACEILHKVDDSHFALYCDDRQAQRRARRRQACGCLHLRRQGDWKRPFFGDLAVAGASFFTLIDDIATLLDDVAVLSKVAVGKTAGVLGDDLALNAQQLTGVNAARELPVVYAVARGSLINKTILVPLALAISAWLPWAVVPLLMIGGAYLCYEGCEKLLHKFLHDPHEEADAHARLAEATRNEDVDMVVFEKKKIAGAIRTDFILSAEIIVITLGTVAAAPFAQRIAVLVAIAIGMTVGVYGLVAAIIKLDDLGLALCQKQGSGYWRRGQRWLGRAILMIAPYLLKLLSIAGTAAMFIVGGSILTHGVERVHHAVETWSHKLDTIPGIGVLLGGLASMALNALAGLAVGAAVLAIVLLAKRLLKKPTPSAPAH